MKLKHLFLGSIALFALLTSCSKDAIDQQPMQPQGTAYMTLTLGGSSMSRTSAGQGTINGTPAENKIETASVILANPSNHKVMYTYDITSGLTQTNDYVKTQPILVSEGTYDVYVVANNTSLTSVGTDLTGITITNITEALMQSAHAASNKFIMFNQCNGTDDIGGKRITITAANDYNHPAICDMIYLDRLAAKITSTTASSMDISGVKSELNKITNVTLIGAKLINGATKTYLQQHWTGLKPTAQALQYNNTLLSPLMSISEYYNAYKDFRTAVYTVNTDGTLHYTIAKDNYADFPYYAGNLDPIYCMENNPTWNGDKGKFGNVTGIVYQCQATVPESDGLAGANTFYAISGMYFASLADLQATYTGTFQAAAGTTNAEKLASATAELVAANSAGEDAISNFRTKYNVKVYKSGIIYYTYFIKDQNYLDGNGLIDYLVTRNTVYGLTINSLTRIGTDIPGGWVPNTDPDDPIENNDVYMVVRVTVNPWVISNINIDLQ